MNWEAISAVSEVLGAIAVVVSIAYLARQVRHGVNFIQNVTYSETASSWRESLGITMQHTDQFLSGVTLYVSMTSTDRWKFNTLMHIQMANFENFLLKRQKGWIDEEQGERWRQVLIWYLSWPGVEQWWNQYSQNVYQEISDLRQ